MKEQIEKVVLNREETVTEGKKRREISKKRWLGVSDIEMASICSEVDAEIKLSGS